MKKKQRLRLENKRTIHFLIDMHSNYVDKLTRKRDREDNAESPGYF